MKKTISAVAALTFAATLAVAAPQGGEGKGGFHGKRGKGAHSQRLAEKLNLSDAQKAQAAQLQAQFRAENEPLFNQLKQTKTDLRAARQANDTARVDALKAAMKSQHAQLKSRRQAQHDRFVSILTAEQRAQLETMKAQRGDRGGKHGKRGNRGNQQLQ